MYIIYRLLKSTFDNDLLHVCIYTHKIEFFLGYDPFQKYMYKKMNVRTSYK